MGLNDVNLSGSRILEARLNISAWGASYHDVTLDTEVALAGAQTLNIADLAVKCAVLSGGASFGRSTYRLVAGAGGWGKTLPSKSYANDLGVKMLQVLTDAAQAVGETLDATTIDPKATVGPQWTRDAGPAGRVLERLAPNAWYVGEDGITRLGARAPSSLASRTTVESLDLARGTALLSGDSIAGILPGLVVNGTSTTGPWSLTALDVEHTVADGALRSKVWGQQGAGTSRLLAAWRAINDQLDPDRAFRAFYEYRVVTQSVNRLNLQPVQVSTGMPVLQIVPMRPGIPGANMKPALGSRVLVGFVNGDPGRPFVHSFEDPDGSGFVPLTVSINASTSITFAGGGPAVGRVGDSVNAGYLVTTSTGLVVSYFPGTAAGLTAATAAAGALMPPGAVVSMTGAQITSGSPKVSSG